MSRTRAVAVVVLPFIVLGGCSGGDDGGGSGSEDTQAAGIILTVYRGNETVMEWTLDGLRAAVEFVDLDIEGKTQSGPLLADVLEASGVDAWTHGEVLGKGEGRAFDVGIDIAAGEIDEGWILDVTNRGTLKLAAEDLPQDRWVRDVGEIRLDG
jgi:hypothetical protein